jgi:UDP-N-acetylglucosamine diphosphorylase/glucosamine-1-phosphate N-acetyltransferase
MKRPDTAKVMFGLNGRPMIEYAVRLAAGLRGDRILFVVGWQKQAVIDHVSAMNPEIEFVHQDEQLGTGHAVQQAMVPLGAFAGDVLVLSGDVPLLAEKTARALVGYHRTEQAAATVLTAEVADPTGYGRVVRGADGSVVKIVEQRDGSQKELAIREINSGIYVFDKEKLAGALAQLRPENAQGEYYLTDVFAFFWKNSWRVAAVKALDAIEVIGINDADQLMAAAKLLAERNAQD